MTQKLLNVVSMGDATMSTADLQTKKTALQNALNTIDTLALGSYFAGTEAGSRIASHQAQLRAIVAAELEGVTHRLAGTGPFRSPA